MNNTKKIYYYIIGLLVPVFTGIIHLMTVQASVSFWDCGEVAAAAYGMQVPHPPGSPFHTLLVRFFSMFPFAENLGHRINLFSVFVSCISVYLLYLTIVKLIENYRGKNYASNSEAIITYVSAAIGALAFGFSHSFWFNATESEIYATNTLSFGLIVYLIMLWNEKSEQYDSTKYILLIAYVVGLTTGIRMFGVLTIITVAMIIMFKKYVTDEEAAKLSGYILLGHIAFVMIIACVLWGNETSTTPPSPEEYKAFDMKFKAMLVVASLPFAFFWKKIFNRNSIYIAILVGAVAKFLIFDIIVKQIPVVLGSIAGNNWNMAITIFLLIFAGLGFAIYYAYKNKLEVVHTLALSVLFILIGYSTYSVIIIRANATPPMNENEPKDFTELVSYLNRTQYGDWPTFKRRFATEPHQMGVYANYSSDLDFWWRYQMNHMMTRYILWTYGGRENWVQDAGPNVYPFNGIANTFFGKIFNLRFGGDAHNSFFGIPFLIGLIGIVYHFRKDWKTASAFMILFIIVSYLFAFYQNQQEPQPRERDKFLAPLGLVFAVWIGIGVSGLVDKARQLIKAPAINKLAPGFILILAFAFIPLRMVQANYHEHDRSKNWIPWDLAYNLLQSCAPNAILITNGDNDTFPLWFLQDVEGVRRDIRVVNLSLGNTPWYIYQLKNYEPYGTPKVKITIPDERMNENDLRPTQWEPTTLSIPVPRNFAQLSLNYKNPEMKDKYLALSGKKSFDEYDIKDSSVVREGKLTWVMPATLNYGDVKGIRVQDLLVKEIVENNNWERPIYFSVTCSEDCKIGLSEYLKMEGVAFRLVPERKPGDNEFMNESVMRKQLYDERDDYSKEYRPGFKFRGIASGELAMDDNQERLIQNYRNSFIRLALYYLKNNNDQAKANATLELMEKKIPRNIVRIDHRLLFDIAGLYKQAGNEKEYNTILGEVEVEALKDLEQNPMDVNGYYNPYNILLTIYEYRHETKKAVDLLNQLKKIDPRQTEGINMRIQRLMNPPQVSQK
ncbi:MAG: DUF2723 domain-containing protein [Ignavibacteria bacterium]|nr:DUF2723 domain-containing protein [Ignavibacteria bacterium]